jgi:hypothetical protein
MEGTSFERCVLFNSSFMNICGATAPFFYDLFNMPDQAKECVEKTKQISTPLCLKKLEAIFNQASDRFEYNWLAIIANDIKTKVSVLETSVNKMEQTAAVIFIETCSCALDFVYPEVTLLVKLESS